MLICCENCKRIYSFEENDGLCPKCGCYNNISHQDSERLEQERESRRYRRLAQLEEQGSLCDAEDVGDPAASFVYAPDCMEKSHDHSHIHTGGAHITAWQEKAAALKDIAVKKSDTSVKRAAASKNVAATRKAPVTKKATPDHGRTSFPAQYLKSKAGALIFFAVLWVIFVLTALIRFAAAAG